MNILDRFQFINMTNISVGPKIFIDFYISYEKRINIPQYRNFNLRFKFFKYGILFILRLNKMGEIDD